ncbi:hypothetical protein P8452_05799 [Trifolium repens]|nr:hypothetical protein P8452_05799 [Trifolium repens]
MAPHVHRLSAYASQRLVSLFDMLSRKYNKLADRRDNKLHVAKENSIEGNNFVEDVLCSNEFKIAKIKQEKKKNVS